MSAEGTPPDGTLARGTVAEALDRARGALPHFRHHHLRATSSPSRSRGPNSAWASAPAARTCSIPTAKTTAAGPNSRRSSANQDDVTVVVHSDDPAAVPPILDELAAKLNRQPKLFRSVFHKIDVARLKSKGLYNDQVSPQFLAADQRLPRPVAGPAARRPRLAERGRADRLVRRADRSRRFPRPATRTRVLGAPSGAPNAPTDWLARAATTGQVAGDPRGGPQASPGRTNRRSRKSPRWWPCKAINSAPATNCSATVTWDCWRLYLVKNERSGSFAEYSDGLSELRQIVSDTKNRHPEAWVGLTGLPVMENDEMESSQTAMAEAGVLSFIGVGLLYVAGFGCVRHPVMALAALLVPMGWSFGYILMTVGHLNILSSAFATIVIGLGSDYGVYHIAQYLRYRGEKMSTFDALLATTRSIGPGLTTSAVATAAGLLFDRSERFSGHRRVGHHCRRRHLVVLAGRTYHAAGLDPLVRRPSAALARARPAGCLRLLPTVGQPAEAGGGRLCRLHGPGLPRD